MPIYEYKCENGHVFEAIQRMADDPLTVCEVCAAPVQRLLHAPAVHFKGSGFYNTDYGTKRRAREKAAADAAKKESSSAKSDSSAKKPDSSSDSKPSKPSESSAGKPAASAAASKS